MTRWKTGHTIGTAGLGTVVCALLMAGGGVAHGDDRGDLGTPNTIEPWLTCDRPDVQCVVLDPDRLGQGSLRGDTLTGGAAVAGTDLDGAIPGGQVCTGEAVGGDDMTCVRDADASRVENVDAIVALPALTG